MLSSDLQEPVVTNTSVLLDLFHALNVFSDLDFEVVRADVHIQAISEVVTPVESPHGDIERAGIVDYFGNLVPVLLRNLACAELSRDVGSTEDHVREAAADSLDRGDSIAYASASLEVGVEHTDDVFEIFWFLEHEAEIGRAHV